MFESAKVKAGATKRIEYVAWAEDGSLVTGLRPTIRIMCESGDNAGKFLNGGISDIWLGTPAADPELTELDAANMPGQYYIDWTIPATAGIGYSLRVDGGETVANRYAYGRIEVIAISENDLSSGIVVGGGHPVNIAVMPALLGTGADDPVEVPRGSKLAFRADGNVELRDVLGGEKITIPPGSFFCTGESLGQTVYLRAAVGTTIELAMM